MTTSAAKANRNADIVDRLEAENERLHAALAQVVSLWPRATDMRAVAATALEQKAD